MASEGPQNGQLAEGDATCIYQQLVHSFRGKTPKRFNNIATTTKFFAANKKVTHSRTSKTALFTWVDLVNTVKPA